MFRRSAAIRDVFRAIGHAKFLPEYVQQPMYLSTNAYNDNKENFTSRTKRDDKIRFFLLKKRSGDALDLLEHSLSKTPVKDSRGNMRFLKLPPETVINKVIVSICSSNDLELAMRAAGMVRKILDQSTCLTWTTVTALTCRLINIGQSATAFLVVDQWLAFKSGIVVKDKAEFERANAFMYSLIEISSNKDDFDSILGVLKRMAQFALVPGPKLISLLMGFFARNGKLNISYSLLDWMKRSGLGCGIDSSHYQSLVVYSQAFNPKESLRHGQKVLNDMLENNITPTSQFLGSYLRLCGRAGDVEEAENFWNYLISTGIQLDTFAFNELIDVYSKAHLEEKALKCYESMISYGMKAEMGVYEGIIGALRSEHYISTVKVIWDDMIRSGVRPNNQLRLLYLKALIAHDIDEAIVFLLSETMPSNNTLWENALLFASYPQDKIKYCRLLSGILDHQVPVNIRMLLSILQSITRMLEWQHAYLLDFPAEYADHAKGFLDLDIKSCSHIIQGMRRHINEDIGSSTNKQNDEIFVEPKVEDVISHICLLTVNEEIESSISLYDKISWNFRDSSRALMLNILLYGAINHRDDLMKANHVLQIVRRARAWTEEGGTWWFDRRTQLLIIQELTKTSMRKCPDGVNNTCVF